MYKYFTTKMASPIGLEPTFSPPLQITVSKTELGTGTMINIFMKLKEILKEVYILPKNIEKMTKPLLDTDTIRVYHGTSSADLLITALTSGVTGDKRISRLYSYENNNNPRGIFVTPDFDTAKEFGCYIIELHTTVKNLEAPVWPNDKFTTQGEYSSYFVNDKEREQKILQKRQQEAKNDSIIIKHSTRPELASSLLIGTERQALFIGDLNSNSIRSIWIANNPDKTNTNYSRYNRKEVLALYNNNKLPTKYNIHYTPDTRKNDKSDITIDAMSKLIKPRDIATIDDLLNGIQAHYKGKLSITRKELVNILKNNEDYIRNLVWSDRQVKEIQKELSNEIN